MLRVGDPGRKKRYGTKLMSKHFDLGEFIRTAILIVLFFSYINGGGAPPNICRCYTLMISNVLKAHTIGGSPLLNR